MHENVYTAENMTSLAQMCAMCWPLLHMKPVIASLFAGRGTVCIVRLYAFVCVLFFLLQARILFSTFASHKFVIQLVLGMGKTRWKRSGKSEVGMRWPYLLAWAGCSKQAARGVTVEGTRDRGRKQWMGPRLRQRKQGNKVCFSSAVSWQWGQCRQCIQLGDRKP